MTYIPTTFVNGVTAYNATEANKMGSGIQAAHVLKDRFDETAMAAAGEPNILAYFQGSGKWGPRLLISTDSPGVIRETVTGTTYTMANADQGKLKHFTSGSSITVTFPAGLSTVADAVFYFRQYAAGVVTTVGSGGTVVNSRGGTLKSAGQYAEWQATRVGTSNEYILSGDLVV